MLNLLRRWYRDSSVGRLALALPRQAYRYYRFRLLPEERFIRSQYRRAFGRELDLNNPTRFSEKIQWLKLNDRRPLHTQCADKLAVRAYVTEKVGEKYLIPLLLSTEDPLVISPENLPDPPFVIKATHCSGGVTLVRDKSAVDWETLQKKLGRLLRTNFYYPRKEWQYLNIHPRIVVEQMVEPAQGVVPADYKIYCFGGRPEYIQLITGRYVDTRECFYSTEWEPCNFRLTYPFIENSPKRPENLTEMLEVAARLSSEFAYCRIDLYNEDGRVYFGEITHHPDSGFSSFDPPEWDLTLGNMLELPKVNVHPTGECRSRHAE
jgi:hypothetical protein